MYIITLEKYIRKTIEELGETMSENLPTSKESLMSWRNVIKNL